MLYMVEVAIDVGNLGLEFGQMRTWLDHMKFQAIGFRQNGLCTSIRFA